MGKRGPAPKPTALRLLHGDRKDRVNTDEPPAPQGVPVCPEEAAPEVREVWAYTVEQLVRMGTASTADRDALLCYCEAVVTHRRASAMAAQMAPLIEGHRGVMVRNPAIAMQRDAATTIRAFAGEFGLTPSARSEIRKGAANNDAPAAKYLNA